MSINAIRYMLYILEKIYKWNFDGNSLLHKSNKIAKDIIAV